MKSDNKMAVITILFTVVIAVSGGYLFVSIEQPTQNTQQAVTGTTDTTPPQSNSSATNSSIEPPRDGVIAAPSRPTVVTTNHSAPRAVTLSAGESTTVTVELTATQRLSDVRVNTTDPLGLTVTSEPAAVTRLDADESTTYSFTVRADRSVSRTLDVVVRATQDNRTVSQRISYSVDALENAGNGTQSDAVQTASFAAVGAPMTTTESTDQRSLAAASSEVAVSGQAAYTDPSGRLYGLSAVRVELYDVDGDQTQLAQTTTAENGDFTFRLDPENDADGDGTIEAAVVIYAENDAAYVTDGSDVYGFVAQTSPLSGGDTATLGTDLDGDSSKELVATGDNAPFQAVDWAHDAYEFGTDSSLAGEQVPIQYPTGDWAYYTYRADGSQLIQLPQRSYYAWEQKTIYHEYGHSVFFQLQDFSLVDTGSYPCHVYVSETDPGYALVEGFAAYYTAAVADDPTAVSWGTQNIEHNQFYDTTYTGQCADGDASGEYDGLSAEGSAASIFWDITDAGPNDDDRMSYRFATIAETLRSEPDNMAEFRTAWRGGDEAALDEIYTAYGIDRLPPRITYSVDDAPYTDSDVRFSGTVDDEREVRELEMRVNDGPYRPIEHNDGRWSASRTLPDGTSTVSVRATDPGGFTQETTKTVRVSSNSPSASITAVRTAGLASSDATAQVDFTYAVRYPDTATVRVLRDDETVATKSLSTLDGAASGTDASASIALPETTSAGTYTFELVVTDDAGRTATDQYTTTSGTAAPATITGDVVNETGVTFPDATVQLYAESDTDFSNSLQTTQTNTAGSYTISSVDGEALRRGETYTVRVSADGTTANRTLGPLQSGVNDGDIVIPAAGQDGTVTLSDFSPATVTAGAGENITVSVTATNAGETAQTRSIVLRVAGTPVSTRDITLASGENGTVTFDVELPALDSGEYIYSVSTDERRQNGTLTVDDSKAESRTLVDQYDTNDDSRIELQELTTAATDYANGELSLASLAEVARAYST